MTAQPWFRMYSEFASDPKVQMLAFEDQRHFIVLLCLKCNGTLDASIPSADFRERMIARGLGLSPESAAEAKRRLLEVGLIDADWSPIKWDDRQFRSDSSAERTRKWRDKRAERHGDVTVTPQNRTEQNRTETEGDASVTPPQVKVDSPNPAPEARGSRLPDDFTLTPERRQVAMTERVNPERTFARFCDHWRAASGATARKRDWDAAWRNWCRKDADMRRPAGPAAEPSALNPHAHLDMR